MNSQREAFEKWILSGYPGCAIDELDAHYVKHSWAAWQAATEQGDEAEIQDARERDGPFPDEYDTWMCDDCIDKCKAVWQDCTVCRGSGKEGPSECEDCCGSGGGHVCVQELDDIAPAEQGVGEPVAITEWEYPDEDPDFSGDLVVVWLTGRDLGPGTKLYKHPPKPTGTTNAQLHGAEFPGWQCFHCGEVFTTVGGARDHFGTTPEYVPGCMVRVQLGEERGLLMQVRELEAQLQAHDEELPEPTGGGVPEAVCPECGSGELSWHCGQTVNSGVVDGRLRLSDVSTVFYLGCEACSETIEIKTGVEIAALLGNQQPPDSAE